MPLTHSRWIYVLPSIHFCICLLTMSGYVVPQLEFLGILGTFIMLADFPISLVALALTWKHEVLAAIWIVAAGTLWWYLLSRVLELLVHRIKPLSEGPLGKLN